MLFDRHPKYDQYQWSPRKLAAAQKKPIKTAKKLQEKIPLFADQVHIPEFDADAVLAERRERHSSFDLTMRSLKARQWIEARADFFQLSLHQKFYVAVHWAGWKGPRNPSCFGYLVKQARKGGVV